MQTLELLAPARSADIGIAAIDCGADAVYIGAPDFGARKAAGNSFEDIRRLCEYAHRFGVSVFVTFNTILRSDEREEAHRQMLLAQDAGADALIIRDLEICGFEDIRIPLHASTQCAIRDADRALECQNAGCSRIVLERELSLEQIRGIRKATSCELECFVHGAICVCYSGDCRLSEHIDGRSADRGECIQACRSLYDLVDENGNVLVHNKALLSLKDFRLAERLGDLAEAGVCSFKIEGRLKSASYVKNVVREYSLALDKLIAGHPDQYRRSSFGKIRGGFKPDSFKTFNRGYTELFLDGKRGGWSSMDAPKSMGEQVGEVVGVRRMNDGSLEVRVKTGMSFNNGDGFAFVAGDRIVGFRGDVCQGNTIRCKAVDRLKPGVLLFRNINAAFEKELESNLCRRELDVDVDIFVEGRFNIVFTARCEDGRTVNSSFKADVETAENRERAEAMIREQIGKRAGIFAFRVASFQAGPVLPLLSSSTINSMRRLLAQDLESVPGKSIRDCGRTAPASRKPAANPVPAHPEELMRSKYCIRHELGICLKENRGPAKLFLTNNGRRFPLGFDCAACEMTVLKDSKKA